MHCPGCGTQTSSEQKFCRVCGVNLEVVSKALAADDTHATSGSSGGRRMMLWMTWGIIIMFAGVLLGITGKKLIHDDIVSGVGALIAVAGIFLICFGSLPTLATCKRARHEREAITPDEAKPTLPLQFELPPASVSSVTEGTTELFEVERLKVSARKRD